MRWLDELQRMSVDRPRRRTSRDASASSPTPPTCCPSCDLPTLVLHCRGDQMNAVRRGAAPSPPASRSAAGRRSRADNHIVLADEPAWPVFLREVAEFLAPTGPAPRRRRTADVAELLSPRELEVLRLAADGHDNDAIAAGPDPERAHRRAAPAEHLRQARPPRPLGPHRRRGPAAHQRLTTQHAATDARTSRVDCASAPMRAPPSRFLRRFSPETTNRGEPP